MPTVYGSWAPNGSTNQRMRLSVEYSVSSPGPGDTSVTVSGTVRLHAGYSFYHNGALFNRWGTLIGGTVEDDSINVNVPTNGSQAIFTFNRSAAIGTSASSLSFGFSVRGISYVGSGTVANVTGNIPLPARTSSPAPTNVVVSWPNPTTSSNLTLTWSGGPIHAIEHRSRTTIGASGTVPWGPWQPYSGVEQSSPCTITALGGYYERQFRVRRGTGAAASPWAYSNAIRHFLQPNEPTNVQVSRQSDSRHTVTWSYNDTWNRPAQYFSINRYSTKYGTWVRIAAPSRGARSWVDTSNYSNDYIGYRVIAVNAWAGIESTDSAWVRTTPAAATGVTATRTGPNSAQMTWVVNAVAASHQQVQQQTSSDMGVTWSAWVDRGGTFSASATSTGLENLDAALWYRFRIRTDALNNPGTPNLYAYSGASAIIKPAAAPLAPTLWAPSGVVSSAADVEFRWTHNPTDGSAQTAYELNYRRVGESTWEIVTESNTDSGGTAVSIPDAGVYEARVRTRGQHASWSPWSPTGSFEVLDPPVVTVVSPSSTETYPSNRLVVEIIYTDLTGSIMTGSRVELQDDTGAFITAGFGDGASTRIVVPHDLDNLTDYRIQVEVTSGTGLRSELVEVEFSTDFLPPVAPDVTVEWLDVEGLVRLAVANHPGVVDVTVDTAHNRLERSTDLGETWVTIGDDLPLDVGFDDTLVPLSTIVWYRAVAVGELGTEAATDPPIGVETVSSRVWLTGEDGATLMVLANPSLDYSDGHERVSEMYYGRSKPTAHYGEGLPVTVGVSGDLVHDMGYGQDVAALLAQDVFYRDPYGRAFWASVTDGFSRGMDSGGHQLQSISFTVEQVHRVAS